MKKNPRGVARLIPIQQAGYMVLACGLLAASIAMFFLETNITMPFFARPFNLYRIAVMSLATIFLIKATNDRFYDNTPRPEPTAGTKTQRLITICRFAIPALSLICCTIQLFWPSLAVIIIRKEDWPMYRNGIFVKVALQLLSFVFFTLILKHYLASRQWLAVVVTTLAATVLIVLMGEELSWGQRIFNWTTPAWFSVHNQQNETNLHNLATQVFQNAFYFGGWTVLIALPFWRNFIARIFSKFKQLRFLIDWLPSLSFIFIFAPAFGFGDPANSETGLGYGSNLFITVSIIVILVTLSTTAIQKRDSKLLGNSFITLLMFIAILTASLLNDQVWQLSTGAMTDYLEVFINMGIALWSITIYSRLVNSRQSQISNLKAPKSGSTRQHYAI